MTAFPKANAASKASSSVGYLTVSGLVSGIFLVGLIGLLGPLLQIISGTKPSGFDGRTITRMVAPL